MVISWSDAVKDADNSDDLQRYERAVQQANDLEPLIISFGEAVRRAGQWPQNVHEWSDVRTDATLNTRGWDDRHVWLAPDGQWGLNLGTAGRSLGISGSLMNKRFRQEPMFGYREKTVTLAAEEFHARMDAMEQTKDWVPRELVAYLRMSGIPIPG